MKRAGFTPRGMTGTAVGVLATRGGRRALEWEGPDENPFLFLEGDALEGALPDDGERVRVSGAVTVERGERARPPELAVVLRARELEVLDP